MMRIMSQLDDFEDPESTTAALFIWAVGKTGPGIGCTVGAEGEAGTQGIPESHGEPVTLQKVETQAQNTSPTSNRR